MPRRAALLPVLLFCYLAAALAAAPAMETVSQMFTVPEGAGAGHRLVIKLPWGGNHTVVVPEGKTAGDKIKVTLERPATPAYVNQKEWLQQQQLAYFRAALTRMYNEPALEVPEAKRSAAAIEKVVDKYWPDRVSQLWAGLAKKYPASSRAQMAAGNRPSWPSEDAWIPVPAAETGRATSMGEPYVLKENFDQATAHTQAGAAAMEGATGGTGYAAAVEIFKKALEIDPYESQALAMLGWIWMTTRRSTTAEVEDAMFFLRASLEVAPANVGNRLNLALLLKDVGTLDEAQTELQRLKRMLRPTHEKYKTVVKHLGECDAALSEMKDEI